MRKGAISVPDVISGPVVGHGRQRVDKWLWHARMVRTRSAAAELAASGRVRINGQRVESASRPVRAGDIVTLALDRSVRMLKVLGFSEQRWSYERARILYEEVSPRLSAGAVSEQAEGSERSVCKKRPAGR